MVEAVKTLSRSEVIEQARKRRALEDKRRAPVCGGSITSQKLDLSVAQAAVKEIPPIPIVKHSHREWIREQQISSFCSRYSNRDDLACDLTDIISGNTAADAMIRKALFNCGLEAQEVLNFLEKEI